MYFLDSGLQIAGASPESLSKGRPRVECAVAGTSPARQTNCSAEELLATQGAREHVMLGDWAATTGRVCEYGSVEWDLMAGSLFACDQHVSSVRAPDEEVTPMTRFGHAARGTLSGAPKSAHADNRRASSRSTRAYGGAVASYPNRDLDTCINIRATSTGRKAYLQAGGFSTWPWLRHKPTEPESEARPAR